MKLKLPDDSIIEDDVASLLAWAQSTRHGFVYTHNETTVVLPPLDELVELLESQCEWDVVLMSDQDWLEWNQGVSLAAQDVDIETLEATLNGDELIAQEDAEKALLKSRLEVTVASVIDHSTSESESESDSESEFEDERVKEKTIEALTKSFSYAHVLSQDSGDWTVVGSKKHAHLSLSPPVFLSPKPIIRSDGANAISKSKSPLKTLISSRQRSIKDTLKELKEEMNAISNTVSLLSKSLERLSSKHEQIASLLLDHEE